MIYLLEDDSTIRNFVIYALQHSDLEARGFETPSAFWKAMQENKPDLLLLDRMLPEEDGMEILKKLRADPETADMPIMMLTALGTEYDKVVGLDCGADDYITKPFGTMELISRIRALLRRTKKREKPGAVRLGGITLNREQHTVEVSGEPVQLTFKEFALLSLLMSGPGRVFSRDEILREIWGYEFDGESRTVDVHVRTLRAKLKDAGKQIETVRGVGYRIVQGE